VHHNGTVFGSTVFDVHGRVPVPFGATWFLTDERETSRSRAVRSETGVTNDNLVLAIRAFRSPIRRGQNRGL
jgi:hypothetical protein